MIRRTFDSEEINNIINNPDVFKHVCLPSQHFIDVSEEIKNKDNVFLIGDGCGFAFIPYEGMYDGHSFALKSSRGRKVLECGREALRWIFNYGAKAICGFTPVSNLPARKFSRLLGFKSFGIKKHKFKNGDELECEHFLMFKKDFQ